MNTRVKPLNPTKIHVMVYENGATLEELADEYGMSVEELCKKAKVVVGSKKFEAIKRKCLRNEKARKKLQGKIERKSKSKETVKKEESVEEKKEKLKKSIEQAKTRATQEYEKIKQMIVECRTKGIGLETAEREFVEAQNAYQQAEKSLQLARKAYEDVKREKNRHQQSFLMLTRQRKKLQEQLDEFYKDDIYLISPNYHGELPRVGKFISTKNISGINVKIEYGTELIEEPNDLIYSADYLSIVEFAKLVLKYYLGDEEDKITILVNDDEYKQILKLQGIEI